MSDAALATPPPPSDVEPAPALATPERALSAFVAALSRGEVDAAAACVSRSACLVTPDATAISGRDGIRPVLAQLIALRLQVQVEVDWLLVADDVALGRGRWRGHSPEPGTPRSYAQDWRSTVVLKRMEGEWKLHIVSPWESERPGGEWRRG